MWKGAEEFLLKDKYIGPLIKKYGHCKIRPRDKKYYFEDLVDSIVQQQLSMKAAASIFERLKEKISDKNDSKKSRKHRWRNRSTSNIRVTPEKILFLSDKELRGCGLSFAKARYLKDLSYKVISNNLKVTRLDRFSDEEVMKELITVKGIGRWTAEMFLMFTLARADIFPVDDLGLRNAFKKLVKKDMESKKIEKFVERWRPYRTIASWYLWATLENK